MIDDASHPGSDGLRVLDDLPGDRPFSRSEARHRGVEDRHLSWLVGSGALRRPVPGVYCSEQLADSLSLRLACLRLVVPADAVVTDRTAAWLWGVSMALAADDHLSVPRVSVFRPRGYRLRNAIVASGSRDLAETDVVELEDVRVTTPVRTACDLGRLLTRDQAIAALDGLVRDTTLTVGRLRAEVERFRGYRGVCQLRELAPLADGRAQSPGESILRLRWLGCPGLPAPEPQLEVAGPAGSYFLDLGIWRPRLAAEYDGAAWHSVDQTDHDAQRRAWLRDELGFTVVVLRSRHLAEGPTAVERMLRAGFDEAQARAARPAYWINDHIA